MMENTEQFNTASLGNICSAISIHDSNHTEVLRIETDGRIFWRPQGSTELTQITMDKDLSIAFSLCVEMLSGSPYKSLMETVRTNAVKDKADAIGNAVADYLVDIKLATTEHRDIHVKNVKIIVNGI